jgi:hypothetical protein
MWCTLNINHSAGEPFRTICHGSTASQVRLQKTMDCSDTFSWGQPAMDQMLSSLCLGVMHNTESSLCPYTWVSVGIWINNTANAPDDFKSVCPSCTEGCLEPYSFNGISSWDNSHANYRKEEDLSYLFPSPTTFLMLVSGPFTLLCIHLALRNFHSCMNRLTDWLSNQPSNQPTN